MAKSCCRNLAGNIPVQLPSQQRLGLPSLRACWLAFSSNKTCKCPHSNLVQLSDRDRSLLGRLPESGVHSLCLHTTGDGQLTIVPSPIRHLMSSWEENREPCPDSVNIICVSSRAAGLPGWPFPQPAQLCPQLLLGPGPPFYPRSSCPLPRPPSARILATVWSPGPPPPARSVPGLLCVLQRGILPLRPPESRVLRGLVCRASVSFAWG